MAASAARKLNIVQITGAQTKARHVVPSWSVPFHKGQHGRVLVVGGSFEYTGAPYYAAESSLRCGADLSFVACGEGAAAAIKAYSPELIVHGVLPNASSCPSSGSSSVQAGGEVDSRAASAVADLLPRMSALVLGPGLGRASCTMQTSKEILHQAQRASMPTVVDADGLWFAQQQPLAFAGAHSTVLTPNAPELARLKEALGKLESTRLRMRDMQLWLDAAAAEGTALPASLDAVLVSYALNGVAVLAKGPTDTAVLVQGGDSLTLTWAEVATEGSPRRCGGQGDVLAGSLGTFLSWAHMAPKADKSGWDTISTHDSPERIVAAMCGASMLTRTAARLAFAQAGRSTTTPDILGQLGSAFQELFENKID